ncbi:unnamed protein product, partial [Vitis vinifera]
MLHSTRQISSSFGNCLPTTRSQPNKPCWELTNDFVSQLMHFSRAGQLHQKIILNPYISIWDMIEIYIF